MVIGYLFIKHWTIRLRHALTSSNLASVSYVELCEMRRIDSIGQLHAQSINIHSIIELKTDRIQKRQRALTDSVSIMYSLILKLF